MVRADETDAMKKATFGEEEGKRREVLKRRVGRPRTQWTDTAERAGWNSIDAVLRCTEEDYDEGAGHFELLVQAAKERVL